MNWKKEYWGIFFGVLFIIIIVLLALFVIWKYVVVNPTKIVDGLA